MHDMRMGAAKDTEPPMWQAVFKGAAHCGAGCALGDFAAEWIALGLGLVLLGSPLAAQARLELCSRLCGGDRLPVLSPSRRCGA